MPAIQVARTDTFEQQRQKINQLGSTLFNITAGGSDLSTGNLKLGDGTRTAPSVSFISDNTLGIYKELPNRFGFVGSSKKIIDFDIQKLISYKNLSFEKRTLTTSGITVLSGGTNYDPGSYPSVPLLGGTGLGATANIVVTEFVGNINYGTQYNSGSYSNIPLSGGSGVGAKINFDVDGIVGLITNPGNGYVPGTYTNVPIVSVSPSSGSGATATVTVSGATVPVGNITSSGSGYQQGTYTNIFLLNVPTQIFTVTSITNPGTPPPNHVFRINGVTQQSLTLKKGNTYRFDISDSSLSNHPLIFRQTDGSLLPQVDYTVIQKGSPGTANSFIDLVIKPTAGVGNIKYDCSNHPGMGGTIAITSGTTGNYSINVAASITVNSQGSISQCSITTTGLDLNVGTALTVAPTDIGQLSVGSGFVFTITQITYNGVISSITFTSNGLNNYSKNQILSVNDSNIGNGGGSGFQFSVTSNPGVIKNLVFTSKGSGYLVNDVLSLPGVVTGITGTLKGSKNNVSTNLTTTSKTITVSSTVGITSGMTVVGGQIDPGTLPVNTTVTSVDSSTTLTLSNFPLTSGSATLSFTSSGNLSEIVVSNTTGIYVGQLVSVASGSGVLQPNTVVASVNSSTNIITISKNPTTAGIVGLLFSPTYGSSTSFQYTITNLGEIDQLTIASNGNGYFENDLLTVSPSNLTAPIQVVVKHVAIQKISLQGTISSSAFAVGDFLETAQGFTQIPPKILSIKTNSGNIQHLLIESASWVSGTVIKKVGGSTEYTILSVIEDGYRTLLDNNLTPNLTFYVNNTYRFDFTDSSNTDHIFSLSKFRDGIWSPSLIENVSSTLSVTSSNITVNSTSGILPGMEVSVASGVGSLLSNTKVLSVNSSTSITLSSIPNSPGAVILTFRGTEYTDNVTRTTNYLDVKITSDTPNVLYYYCGTNLPNHQNHGGDDNAESFITINQNNPKIFGSGFLAKASQITSIESLLFDIEQESIKSRTLDATTINATNFISTGTINGPLVQSTLLKTDTISALSTNIDINGNVNIDGNFSIESTKVTIDSATGNLNTIGYLKTTNSLIVNDKLKIQNNVISTISDDDIVLSPYSNRITKITGSSALVIPSGLTSDRPNTYAQSGAIRFNTQTNQYEGYSGATSSWSSLGGVRDLDGNTYITAEFTIGSNDNTLWFYNDNINTVKFTPEYQEFAEVKKVRSINTSAPTYVNWAANTPVTVGQYLKYRNNIYEVVTAGVTGSSGNEPISTTGTDFANGTATLKFFITAVAPLTFEEISEVRIAPTGGTSLVINSDLRLATNIISTDTNDLLLRPNSGKKVTVDAKTSLVLPVGTTNERGAPVRGSVRFNTTILQYEGYDGANWSSLGGVRDVDGNTYIIPELTPGGNQNILYFYNNGSNTLRVTENEIQLDTIDTIASPTSNALNLEASLVTFNNLAASIDTSSATRTFISTTKDNLDLGLSSGIVNDPLLRLSDTGDIFYNLGFGTGVFNGIKIFDKGLKELELADYKILTEDVTLTKNTVDTGSSIAYDPSIHRSAKVQIVAHNETTGDKEFVEYSVIDKGSDIFHTDFGNVKTGAELISSVFDFDANNRVRVTFTLDSAISAGNVVKVTVISNIIKR